MRVNKLMILSMAVCGTVMVRAVEFPNPAEFNPTWESAKPGTSYSTDLPTAALLGNGSLGAVNGGGGSKAMWRRMKICPSFQGFRMSTTHGSSASSRITRRSLFRWRRASPTMASG